MTVANDGLTLDESAVHDPGPADAGLTPPAGTDVVDPAIDPPTDLIPLQAATAAGGRLTDAHHQANLNANSPAGAPAPANSPTEGSVEGDLFDSA